MSGQLTICAPLRIEYAAVARGVPYGRARLVRTGMGPERARAAQAQLTGDGPVAILGVAGGLAAHLRSPDLVVASRLVTTDGGEVECPAATRLADLLGAAGLAVHVGTVVSVPKIIEGAERTELADAYGALACDMESGYLVERLSEGRPLAVVRALSDSVTQPLFRVGTIPRGIAALSNVRRAATVVCAWAAEITRD
jgi:4-hydroxy-3-methylbut-2-enyl diphosphate reductase